MITVLLSINSSSELIFRCTASKFDVSHYGLMDSCDDLRFSVSIAESRTRRFSY
jgi:hypothetical protein